MRVLTILHRRSLESGQTGELPGGWSDGAHYAGQVADPPGAGQA
jgi:hypothetical protein